MSIGKRILARMGATLVPMAAVMCVGAVSAQEQHDRGEPQRAEPQHGAPQRAPEHPMTRPGEPHAGPSGYQRAPEPQGWNARPGTVDRGAYQHNFQAARSYRIGPYHRPPGWAPHHWVYGMMLPRAYWAAAYIISDYWLFGLEVPPAGFEWVRDGADALLISTGNGEILQVEYGVFA